MEGDGKKKFSWDDHFFGSVTVGERGQVVIPADAQTLQYAQDLAALLPADDAARLLKLLTARWDGVKRALPAARRKVVEDIRNTMFDKAREVLSSAAQSLPKNPFPPGSMEASRWAAQMTSVEDVLASGNLFRARDELNQMKASIPNG